MSEAFVRVVVHDQGRAVPFEARLRGPGANTDLEQPQRADAASGRGASVDLQAKQTYWLDLQLEQWPLMTFQLLAEEEQRSEGRGAPRLAFRNQTWDRDGNDDKLVTEGPRCCTLVHGIFDDQHVVQFEFALPETPTEVVLVAGWDYKPIADPGEKQKIGSAKRKYALGRRDDLYSGYSLIATQGEIREGKWKQTTKTPSWAGHEIEPERRIDDTTLVTIFEFECGYRYHQLKSNRDSRGEFGFYSVGRKLEGNVRPQRLRLPPAKEEAISITHVYDYIRQVGRRAPGSIKEWSILSHAWYGGPALVDTYEGSSYDAGGAKEHERDPTDKDPRCKDFTDPKVLGQEPAAGEFKQAFAADALLKSWGCFAEPGYREGTTETLEALRAGDPDRHVGLEFNLSYTAAEFRDELINALETEHWNAHLAHFLKLPVWGSPPGMPANLRTVQGRFTDPGGNRVKAKRRYMCPGFDVEKNQSNVYAFYRGEVISKGIDSTGCLPYGD